MEDAGLISGIGELLAAAEIRADGLRVESCSPGGNNRVLRVDAGGRTLVAKCYYRHASDDRDRLSAEYSFLEYAREAGIDCVPRPVARDDRSGIALYEFIDGHKLPPGAAAPGYVEQARQFLASLNEPAKRALAARLPNAAESCFRLADHLALVQGRVERLSLIPATTDLDRQAIALAARLRDLWATLSPRVSSEFGQRGFDRRSALAPADRCISPSDFGFHNAIVTPGGRVTFIDFEYAGWDDPAKTVGDFFSQPEVRVSQDHFESFLSSALRYSPNADRLAERTRLLLPVFRLKWCCIVMNDFLPALLRRRRFADPALDETGRKRAQLEKAGRLLQSIHG
jgi:hypothetical protein